MVRGHVGDRCGRKSARVAGDPGAEASAWVANAMLAAFDGDRDLNLHCYERALALAKEMEHTGRRLPCLIEVNTGEEAQKAGIMPAEADRFIIECRDRLGLRIAGLMCVPPLDEEPAPHFALLREIARRNEVAVLSMGMSADFEKAIRFGATHVRVGTAIFGARGVP